MSALTDLFTALANKIRSKTGTATTYTPSEMVTDGIDDVYDAGYAAGGGGITPTSITPSNSSPASMTAGTAYEPTANGVAIASYSSVTPSNSSPVTLSSGSIYKMGGAGKAVASVSTLTPSDSSPATITSGTIYSAANSGKAVESISLVEPAADPVALYQNVVYKVSDLGYVINNYSSSSKTPSASGASFNSGWNRMTSSGYAYSSKPTGGFSATSLWTNSIPTASFASQTLTISDTSSYQFIRLTFRYSKTNTDTTTVIFLRTDLLDHSCGFGMRNSGSTTASATKYRYCSLPSNTQMGFSNSLGHTTSSQSTSGEYIIPTKIEGLNFTP